ncbi:MAG TPA: Gfo/Idh/MocA family oxidoreductase [Armatimonadetes bacterium]|nr:Gfo/Idh/MocA family oxidoreductase [Armatimonadota bacterium]
MSELGVGIVGYGFIGKVHAYCHKAMWFYYDPVPLKTRLVAVCTARPETAERAKEHGGFEFATTDYRELVEHPQVEIVHCCTPNKFHREVCVAALEAGKHVYCDKPLAMNVREAEEMVRAAERSGKVHMVTFQYRFIPAILRAKELVEEGRVGEVVTFRAAYLHSGYLDPERPMSWRLRRELAGGGALFDLGSHVIDLVHFLLGPIRRVFAVLKTFVTERPVSPGSPERAKVEVDDWAQLLVELEGGAVGTIEASRVATGAEDEIRFEAHGTKGAFYFNSMDPNWLYFFEGTAPEVPLGGERGFKRIASIQRYPEPARLPPRNASIGWVRYHVACLFEFLRAIAEGREAEPSFRAGLEAQRVLEAALVSAREGRWVDLSEVG